MILMDSHLFQEDNQLKACLQEARFINSTIN